MKHLTSAPRRVLRRGALSLGVAAASLAFASAAGAAVITVSPDGNSGTDNFTAALNTANTNSATSNTIVLLPGRYTPQHAPLTISKNLTITGDHTAQGSGGSPAIAMTGQFTTQNNPTSDMFVINSGVNVTMEGFDLDSAGPVQHNGITDNGNLTMWGMDMAGSTGSDLSINTGATATLNETTFNAAHSDQILNSGTLALNNSSIIAGSANGINNSGGTFTLNNTLMAFQGTFECLGGTASNGGPGSLDDDGTCNVQYPSNTAVDSWNYTPDTHGGPTSSVAPPAGDPNVTGKGVNCPTVDQRFFVNPVVNGVRQCDIGAITNGATQETTPPSCTVTGLITGPPKQQQVTLVDSASGIGPNPGPATDNPSNTVPTTRPTGAVPVFGYGVSNLYINNGTVSYTSPSAPTTGGQVLTATKTDQTTGTQWNFTGENWAGVSTFCN
jgi:hypothetical protein